MEATYILVNMWFVWFLLFLKRLFPQRPLFAFKLRLATGRLDEDDEAVPILESLGLFCFVGLVDGYDARAFDAYGRECILHCACFW